MNQTQKKIKVMNLPKRQAGFSMLQWFFILVIAGFFLIFGFKVVPMYSENMYVVSALKSLQDSGSRLQDMSNMEITAKLNNFYMINNVRSDGPTKSLKINRSSDKVLVTVDYETRANFFYNIDLVLKFENHLDSSMPEMCCKPLPGNNASK
jgi:hypothetical protein